MGKISLMIMMAILVSFYLFPVGLTFLPANINTKNLLSLIGVIWLAFDLLNKRDLGMPTHFLGATIFAILFSLICFFSMDINHSTDTSYATYFVSFSVWMFGAYTVSKGISFVHGASNFKRLTCYLAFVCCVQCVLAVMIDRIPALRLFVDRYIEQGQEFFKEVDRLYGIGASLDNAGVRFAVVLLLIMALVIKNVEVRNDRRIFLPLLLAFLWITVVGNMISRTTLLGSAFGLCYFIAASGIFKLVLKAEFFKLYWAFFLLLGIGVPIVMYLYHHDADFYYQIRFAFEGFFNWMEKGEWRTDSTDKLNGTMWVWPVDLKTWVIGTGLFDGWVFGTDIGYCRFILYCGVLGFVVFALFFVYNAFIFGKSNPDYRDLFFFLLGLTFMIWIKVSTDIFAFYALFYCLDYFSSTHLYLQKTMDRSKFTRSSVQTQKII